MICASELSGERLPDMHHAGISALQDCGLSELGQVEADDLARDERHSATNLASGTTPNAAPSPSGHGQAFASAAQRRSGMHSKLGDGSDCGSFIDLTATDASDSDSPGEIIGRTVAVSRVNHSPQHLRNPAISDAGRGPSSALAIDSDV